MKFIKVNYYSVMWKDGVRKAFKTDGGCRILLLSLDSIKSISEPLATSLYETRDDVEKRGSSFKNIKLRLLSTDIANGRGINGVDYDSYMVTEETFKRLEKAIEIL